MKNNSLRSYLPLFLFGLIILCAVIGIAHASPLDWGMLNPKGYVAKQQKILLLDSLGIMLSVVIPVIVMSLVFAWRYHIAYKKRKAHHYQPELHDRVLLEVIWWGIPTFIVLLLSALLWVSTHRLDPYHKLDMPGKPLLVEVVALPWKWLFIYPEQHIAVLNDLKLPVNRQVEFWITADTAMSAFAIPQLGGQIYAMAGMRTRLHLYPTSEGIFEGLNMQFNGIGFSDMHFKATVLAPQAFKQWVAKAQQSTATLDKIQYQVIAKPGVKPTPIIYGHVTDNLFNRIMQKYTQWKGHPSSTHPSIEAIQ